MSTGGKPENAADARTGVADVWEAFLARTDYSSSTDVGKQDLINITARLITGLDTLEQSMFRCSTAFVGGTHASGKSILEIGESDGVP